MINSFDTEVALDVGINAAILYKNIQYWCEFNKTNDKNFHDGYYWTYNSTKAFSQQFKYLSAKQVRTALDVLEEKGYIKVGNFNQLGGDRTKWYTDLKAENKAFAPEGKSKCLGGQMEMPQRANGNAPEGKAIPNINTDVESDINTTNPLISPDEKLKLLFECFWEVYPKKVNKKDAFKAFKGIKNVEKVLPDIITDVEEKKQTKDWQKQNGQFIPYPGSYLRGERWNDVNEAAEKQAKIDEITAENINYFLL